MDQDGYPGSPMGSTKEQHPLWEPGNFGFQDNNSPKLLFPSGASGAPDAGRKCERTEGTVCGVGTSALQHPGAPSGQKPQEWSTGGLTDAAAAGKSLAELLASHGTPGIPGNRQTEPRVPSHGGSPCLLTPMGLAGDSPRSCLLGRAGRAHSCLGIPQLWALEPGGSRNTGIGPCRTAIPVSRGVTTAKPPASPAGALLSLIPTGSATPQAREV